MADDDFYQSGGSSKSSDAESDEDAGQETFMAPKSAFGDKELKVGNKCEVEVVSLYDSEAEFKYLEHKKDDDKKEHKESDKDDDAPGMMDDAHASIDKGIEKMGMGM